MVQEFCDDIGAALRAVADADRVPAMRAYLRDQFDFLGIPTPQRRLAVRALLQAQRGSGPAALLARAQALWELPQREYQYVAIDLLALHWKELSTDHLPALLALVQRKSWWDSVDGLAGVTGDVLRHAHHGMDAALQHGDLWVRRVAMLHQLGWRERTDTARLYAYALALGHEKEFFIQKAIGWALRDYARHDANGVRDFLDRERRHLSALSYREAYKHLGSL